MSDTILLTTTPLDTASAIGSLNSPAAGGIDVFLGCTRAERSADGRELVALDYEAYPEMAVKQLQDLVASARQRWPILRCVLLHRTGRVGLGEPSVLVGVATRHRAESFEACRFLIDELKKSVTIWKKEIWDEGAGTWVVPA